MIDRWLAPDHRYFKVRSRAGEPYILRQDVATQDWDLFFSRSNKAESSF